MAALDFARRLLHHEHSTALTETELREFDTAAEQRYRTMTGMDEPLADRAERARRNAERAPAFTGTKPW